MKNLQKTIAATATLTFLLGSLAAPITVLAKATPTPTASPTPTVTVAPTIAPVVAATPAPQSTLEWILTHKKIDLGILVVVAAVGYSLYSFSTKNKQSPPEEQAKSEDQPKAEEEPKQEDQTPPEDQPKQEE